MKVDLMEDDGLDEILKDITDTPLPNITDTPPDDLDIKPLPFVGDIDETLSDEDLKLDNLEVDIPEVE